MKQSALRLERVTRTLFGPKPSVTKITRHACPDQRNASVDYLIRGHSTHTGTCQQHSFPISAQHPVLYIYRVILKSLNYLKKQIQK